MLAAENTRNAPTCRVSGRKKLVGTKKNNPPDEF
jgi:hypothetical protein